MAGGFALAARLLHAVRWSGAVAGFGVAFTLHLWRGWRMFSVLLAVFVLTWGATRLGYARKQKLGTAEDRAGRSASQVVANVGGAAFALAAVAIAPAWGLLAGCAAFAVLAAAAADTVSSEIGQAYGGTPRMLTTGRPAAPGTNGAVSGVGTTSGFAAAIFIGGLAAALGALPPPAAAAASLAAVLGMFLDSFLGATLERRGLLNNDAVNLLSTLAAAALAVALYSLALPR